MYLKIKRRITVSPRSLLRGVNFLLFCLMMFVKAYGDAALARGTGLSFPDDVKYLVMILAAGMMFLGLVRGGKLRTPLVREFRSFGALMGIWLLISLILAPNFTYPVHFTVKYWIYILLPFFYSFSAAGVLDSRTLETYFKAALVICFGVYLLEEIGLSRFTWANFARISFGNSFSPFESSYSAGSSVMLCAYFGYNRKKNGPWLAASALFCFLTFKRAALVMMAVCLILPAVADPDRRVSRKCIVLQGAAVVGLTVLAALVLRPGHYGWLEKLLGKDLNDFTQGRVWLYGLLIRGGYRPAGLGSSMDFLGDRIGKYGMELELIQLLWEVTVLGLAAFVIYCYSLTRRKLYSVVLMDYVLFNMLVSSSLAAPFEWLLLYLILMDTNRKTAEAPPEPSVPVPAAGRGRDS